MKRGADAVLVGGVVFASMAIACAALFSTMAGSLSRGVGLSSLLLGAGAGLLAARSVARTDIGSDVPGSRSRFLDVLALVAFAAVSIRQFGWVVFEDGGSLLTLLPSNYGDLPLHWTYVSQLAGGAPFWPENPILTGERLRYPFGVDLLSAVFVQLGASLPAVLAVMGLSGAALAALALRRWGGPLAVAGFLFAGGLAGFQILATGRIEDYQDAVAWKSLFLALFVPQRGFLLALPAGLVLLWSWRRRLLRGESSLSPWVEGVLWGALPLVHLHTFLFVSLLAAVWAVGGGPREGRPPDPGLGDPARDVVGLAGYRRPAGCLPRRLETGLDDRCGEPARVSPRQLRPLPAARARRARPGRAGAPARGATRGRTRPRGLRGPLPRAPRAVGMGQHEGPDVVLRRGAAGDRVARARSRRRGVARGARVRPSLLGGRERPRRVARPRAASRGAQPGGVRAASAARWRA